MNEIEQKMNEIEQKMNERHHKKIKKIIIIYILINMFLHTILYTIQYYILYSISYMILYINIDILIIQILYKMNKKRRRYVRERHRDIFYRNDMKLTRFLVLLARSSRKGAVDVCSRGGEYGLRVVSQRIRWQWFHPQFHRKG